ncbi:MAG TPA: 2,3-diphosphoglycerate-dependent phosphoglycerate mutase [bacterium]|nr:2,3-diphosphoglycerate-dependent phosphoglycerate mutase [bacterium]
MYKIVLIRHGESEWNKTGKFTGWVDVDLSPAGLKQSKEAGKLLKKEKFKFDLAYASFLKRTVKTLDIILDEMDLLWLPIKKDWRLNEKHYGCLQGLNKKEMVKKYSEEQVLLWRRSYNLCPPAIKTSSPYNQMTDNCYSFLKKPILTESLKDVENRVASFWQEEIIPQLKKNKKILIVASGNSLRALLKYLDNISAADIVNVNIPVAIPIVLELNNKFKANNWHYLGDTKKISALINNVVKQGKLK